MNQIYEQHLWGGKDFDYFSGQGSHDSNIILPYIKAVTLFFNSHKNPLSVCDLGCGDFNIGKHLFQYTNRYIAIDIVDKLIKRNKTKFRAEALEFHCLDIVKDKLPITDCIILRQVLQHLSNTEIEIILKKMHNYKYLILTEHLPSGAFTPNKDIITGQGIRLKHQSGVDLLEAPFNLKIKEQMTLNTFVLDNNGGEIVTTCYTL